MISLKRFGLIFLNKKNESFEKFKERKTLAKYQTRKKIKNLRTNHGLEFRNHEFSNFCNQIGIARHRTFSEIPQQNGIAKRMYRTFLDKVRCMLKDSALSKRFWAEVVATTCYQINRSPSSSI